MPPKASQVASSSAKAPKKSKPLAKATTIKLDVAPSSSSSQSQRFNPLTAFANTPPSSTNGIPKPSQTQKSKGKGKEKEKEAPFKALAVDAEDDRLWVDIYEPTTEAELAVHVKKVQDVRRWLDEALVGGPSGKLRKYRRILALTGPAGTAKTATMRVLARELDCELLEWRNAMGEASSSIFEDDYQPEGSAYQSYNSDQENLFSKFEAFLTRASTCQSIFTDTERDPSLSSSSSSPPSQSSRSSSTPTRPSATKRKRQIILLEDLPNILHAGTQARFHAALHALVASSPLLTPVPIVIIVSDAGVRGEASDERLANGAWGRDKDGVLDIRTVLSKELLHGPYVTQIGFNPIAPTLMKKALQALLSTHFASAKGSAPSKETLDIVIETSNGDIRSAIMALQFSCVVEAAPSGKKGRGKNSKALAAGSGGSKLVLEAVTRRESSLHLFHLIGRVLYNKRKGDPANPSATAKDIQKDRDLDARLKDPTALPAHLDAEARRTSRVDVDLLYADSPIDSSLFSLYIHQNYTPFCTEVEECGGVAEWLSWVDSSGGEAWYQANPHRFHLLTMGTLHSLPTPVPRRGQKLFKPEFFDYLTKEKDAWDAVRDVRGWIVEDAVARENEGWRLGGWSRTEVVTGLGGVLKARDAKQTQTQAPGSHRLFSSLPFVSGGDSRGLSQLGEGDLPPSDNGDVPDDGGARGGWAHVEDVDEGGGWLDNDDIEDF